MSMNDGGPAFPGEGAMTIRHHEGGDETCSVYSNGMTLRDWFAGQAPEPHADWVEQWARRYFVDKGREVPRNLPHGRVSSKLSAAENLEMLASWRYAYADTMLAERERSV